MRVVGLTAVQILELNSLSGKLRDLEKRFEQLVASRHSEDDRQRQMMEMQKQVELIQQREMKLNREFYDAQRKQSLDTQRLLLRNRDVRTADDVDHKGETESGFAHYDRNSVVISSISNDNNWLKNVFPLCRKDEILG